MTKKLSNSPSVQKASEAWTRGFAAAVRDAAGDSARLTKKKAKEMSGPYADNAQNFFERSGRSWAKVDTVIESGARYVRKSAEKAAGSDKKLSAVDIRSMPKDLSGDIFALQGKKVDDSSGPSSVLAALTSAASAVNHQDLNDYGKSWDVATYPKSTPRADILREIIGYDDLTDDEAEEWFSKTSGKSAVTSFVDEMREVAGEELENRDDDSELKGPDAKKLIDAFAHSVSGALLPVSKLKSVQLLEHSIQEDGDVEHKLILAKQKDDSWLAVRYTNFPF
ncbi:MAG: hypothetical protein HYV07_05535 [Deltaproteobacteria bacterium]|nr:hypothetical protein [Deltaproteobacteria bacterium]